MKHIVLTVVFVASVMTGSAQYGNGSYDCYRHYKMMADYYVGQKEWNYAAKNVLNMMDAEEDSSWSYLEGKNSMELFDALAEEIVSNPRLMTLNKMICVLAIYDIEKKYEETLTLCEKVSDILSQLKGSSTEKDIIQNLSCREPSLAKKISAQLIRFDDLAHWQSDAVRTLLKHTPRTTVLKALINAPQNITKQIQANVPEQIWQPLEKEIHEQKNKTTSEEISLSRKKIVDIARALLQQGKIDI